VIVVGLPTVPPAIVMAEAGNLPVLNMTLPPPTELTLIGAVRVELKVTPAAPKENTADGEVEGLKVNPATVGSVVPVIVGVPIEIVTLDPVPPLVWMLALAPTLIEPLVVFLFSMVSRALVVPGAEARITAPGSTTSLLPEA